MLWQEACGQCRHGVPAFDEISEELDGFIDSEKFSIEGAVFLLTVVEFSREESERFPAVFHILLQNSSNARSEASVEMDVVASGVGKLSVATAFSTSFAVRKASSASGVQVNVTDWPLLQGLIMGKSS